MKLDTDIESPFTGDDDSTLQPPPSDGDAFDVITTDEEAPTEHDQLPSPEEYKARMQGGTAGASFDVAENPQDGDENIHDQLPSVDEYKTSLPTKKSRAGLYTFLCLFLLTVIVTGVAVPLAMKDEASGKSEENALEANTGNFPTIMTATPNNSPSRPPTMPPQMPELSRFEQTKKYLTNYGLVSNAVLDDVSSPQYKAAVWIANTDGYQMPVPTFQNGNQGEKYSNSRFAERYAMAVFYYATGGENWKYDLNFLKPIDVCDWYDVFLAPGGGLVYLGVTKCAQFAPFFDGERITEVEMSNNNLVGILPEELKFLHHLNRWATPFNLNLVDTTSLLPFYGMTENLHNLELQYCGLSGKIPDSLGDMTNLKFLGLGNNLLTGSIPQSFFALTNLEVLGIDDNVLQSPLAPFAAMKSLKKLYLEDNLITGELTMSMISGWTEMIDLDLSVNRLEGPLPSNLWSMKNLEVLDLHGNDFIGQFPEVGSANEKITFVALQNNNLEWRITESIGNLRSLKHLDISANKFVSPFPSTMSFLTNMVSLYTGINGFDKHTVPSFLSSMTNLRELSMKQNKLTGEIPSFLGGLASLQVLDLDFNELTGTIPSALGNLFGLDTLLLNRNYLEGSIPSTFSNLADLDIVVLDGNELTGSADMICGNPLINTTFFSTDCGEPSPEVECSCCSLCCHDSNSTCNNIDWNVNLDGIWEYDYERVVYSFSQDLLPSNAKDKYTVMKPSGEAMTATPNAAPVSDSTITATPVAAPVSDSIITATPVAAPVSNSVITATPVAAPVSDSVITATPVAAPVSDSVITATPVATGQSFDDDDGF